MKGHEIAIYDQDEFHLLDMSLVEVVELVRVNEAKPDGDDAGHARAVFGRRPP